jgi:hypothetical protein
MEIYITRTLESSLIKATKEFPALLVTGPRQSGKTTLLQHTFRSSHRFVHLDEPDLRIMANDDPRLFLLNNPPPVVFDEIQYAPELLHYIKRTIDERRGEKALFLLSGSQSFPLMQGITETLAGRTAVLTLLSMSHIEKSREIVYKPFWDRDMAGNEASLPKEQSASGEEIMASIMRSGFPELIAEPTRDYRLWFASYVQTYLERDLRNIRNIGDLANFQRFLFALAARASQLLNISEIARDVGIAANTAKAWLSILEASFQIVLLKPYYANIGKRVVKTPKLYFLDAGLPAYLTGLADPKHALLGPMGGALFENAVFAEIYRAFVHRGEVPRIFFWRTADGHEVDFVLDFGTRLVPVEVKLSATPTRPMVANLEKFSELFSKQVDQSYLIYLTGKVFKLTPKIIALPYEALS